MVLRSRGESPEVAHAAKELSTSSIAAHRGINIQRPAIDPTGQVSRPAEAVGAKVVRRCCAPDPMMAVNDDLLPRVEFPQAGGEFTQRDELPPEVGSLGLNDLANVEQKDFLTLVNSPLELKDAAMELDFSRLHEITRSASRGRFFG